MAENPKRPVSWWNADFRLWVPDSRDATSPCRLKGYTGQVWKVSNGNWVPTDDPSLVPRLVQGELF